MTDEPVRSSGEPIDLLAALQRSVDAAKLTPAGQFVRERYATPDDERSPDDPLRNPDGWVPCAREHEPGRICIREDGHR